MSKKVLTIREQTIFDGVITRYFLKSIFSLWFKLAGWKVTQATSHGAGVAIAAPHTSNWDFIYALGAAILQDTKIYFSIKDSWCRIPVIGNFMMWLGAIPIDRSSKGKGQVELINQFVVRQKDKKVFFLFTPEGTRSKTQKWKTGFYHVAQSCNIPIFLAKVDYRIKEAGVFHSFQITGEKEEDIQAIQASYKRVAGKFIALQFPPYEGALPKITDAEALVMKALYSFKGFATCVEISTKIKRQELASSVLAFLVDKGIVEETLSDQETGVASYQLTFLGKGCLLHLYPSLA
ncbi:1-acyl-sn-glycerol-3-phosphate acyltransferase [Thalassotalea sp. SU-HH00458]|uniref:1-acyl-sn-glycerol-3-phosphate acyltransferase n=1 Tax=Thalassotalea sp. SU-HH00458 TaxID=3127657 RepID=UPI00310BB51E